MIRTPHSSTRPIAYPPERRPDRGLQKRLAEFSFQRFRGHVIENGKFGVDPLMPLLDDAARKELKDRASNPNSKGAPRTSVTIHPRWHGLEHESRGPGCFLPADDHLRFAFDGHEKRRFRAPRLRRLCAACRGERDASSFLRYNDVCGMRVGCDAWCWVIVV